MGGRRIWPRRCDGIVEFDEETAKIRSLKILIKNSKNWWLYKCYFCKKKLLSTNCPISLICAWKWTEVLDK